MLKRESDHGNSNKEILKQSERAMRKQIIDKKESYLEILFCIIIDKPNNILDEIILHK